MAEKKIVRAAGERKPASNIKVEGNSTGLRIGAVISWIIAIAMEVICVLFISERKALCACEEPSTELYEFCRQPFRVRFRIAKLRC